MATTVTTDNVQLAMQFCDVVQQYPGDHSNNKE
jgi:hypothetical protein